jgi:hypothetical protein
MVDVLDTMQDLYNGTPQQKTYPDSVASGHAPSNVE